MKTLSKTITDVNEADEQFVEEVTDSEGLKLGRIIKWNGNHYFAPNDCNDFGAYALQLITDKLKELDNEQLSK